jgi:hypothetical protein
MGEGRRKEGGRRDGACLREGEKGRWRGRRKLTPGYGGEKVGDYNATSSLCRDWFQSKAPNTKQREKG